MEEETFTDPRIELIKTEIERGMGKVMNESTGQIEQRIFENITLTNRCGDVSKITNKVIGGEIKTFSGQGNNPSVSYEHESTSFEIASAYNTVIHAYVVDNEGNAWDPITSIWGV